MKNHAEKPIVGVSSCLLGKSVRFDGGHKRNATVIDQLGELFDYQHTCPEMAIGLGTPRATIRLVKLAHLKTPRAIDNRDNSIDYTERLRDYGNHYSQFLKPFSGYIFKKNSPSCGMERVKVYGASNIPPEKTGIGIFAEQIMRADPLLPVEEEGRLCDKNLRDNFITRVTIYHEWKKLSAQNPSMVNLVNFHTRMKYLVLAHNETIYRKIGRLIGNSKSSNIKQIMADYIKQLMEGLKTGTNRNKQSNVLYHMAGFFKHKLSPNDKRELLLTIKQYQSGKLPVIAPLTLLSHYLRRYPSHFLGLQYYMDNHYRLVAHSN